MTTSTTLLMQPAVAMQVGGLIKRLDTGEGSYAKELEEDYDVADQLDQVRLVYCVAYKAADAHWLATHTARRCLASLAIQEPETKLITEPGQHAPNARRHLVPRPSLRGC